MRLELGWAPIGVVVVACGMGGCRAMVPQPVVAPALFSERTEELRSDDGTRLRVRHARIRVPVRHDRPGGPMLELAVVRVGLADVGASAGPPHLILAGGPGAPGVEMTVGMARQGGAPLFTLLAGDLIGFDQRGTGESKPNLASDVRYDLPLEPAASVEGWVPIMERASRHVADELTARGIDLHAYNTRESAEDVDRVLAALGAQPVVVWGRSYGSHLALAVARRHPARVARMILIGPEGPDDTLKRPLAADAVLERLSDLVAADPRLGPLIPDLMKLIRSVLAGLERAPVVVEIEDPRSHERRHVTLGPFDVQWLTAQALGDPRLVATLPAAYLEMAGGDFRRVAMVAFSMRQRLGIESAMKQVMDASSGATPARRAMITREAAQSILGNALNFPTAYLASAWGSPDLGDGFRQPVESRIPTLVIVGDLDPRTPVQNGEEIVRHLSRAELVVVRNAGHAFELFAPSELRGLLARFLAGRPVGVQTVSLPAPTFVLSGERR